MMSGSFVRVRGVSFRLSSFVLVMIVIIVIIVIIDIIDAIDIIVIIDAIDILIGVRDGERTKWEEVV